MIDFVVFSLGCKVNIYEGQSMLAKLRQEGLNVSDKLVSARAYIINTCSVTGEADKKSRQAVARVKKLNPDAHVYVCGCSSQNDFEAFAKKNGVRIVGGVGAKAELIDKILLDYKEQRLSAKALIRELPIRYEELFSADIATKTRGFIKVQDGCNNFCSYCIIPYLRGRSRSRQLDSILKEAAEAAKHTKELVISGINLSAYGLDIGFGLIDLVKALKSIPVRKRFGSLECEVITQEFINTALDAGFCDHFHLSMQSGSDTVLKRMNRKYTSADFIKKVEIIRKISPSSGITSDIICGFPFESEYEFNETLQTLKKVRFSDAHVFAYSERKGTPAAKLPQLDKQVRAARAEQVAELIATFKSEFILSQVGKELEVFTEEEDTATSLTTGYSSNYIKVYSNLPPKQIVKVKAISPYMNGLKGTFKPD